MAAKTMTYTPGYGPGPGINTGSIRGYQIGGNTLAFDFNSGATKAGTLSDVILLGKVPNGALITGKFFNFGVAGATSGGSWALQLLVPENAGTLSVYATLVNSMSSGSSAQKFQDYIPYKLSFSDDRAVQYAIVALNCTTGPTETASWSMQGFIHYVTDGSALV